jgi:hypothetical protein
VSNKAITWAYAQTELKPGPRFVLVTLADMADQEHSCYPGKVLLKTLTGFGLTAITTHLETLATGGYLATERRHKKNGARTSDRYYLDVDGALQKAHQEAENVTPESGSTASEPNPGFREDVTPDSGESNPGFRAYVPYIAFNPQLTPSNEPSDSLIAGDELALIAAPEPVDWFAAFWDVYPRHEAKAKAVIAFAKAAKKLSPAGLVDAARRFRDDPNRNPDSKYLPHPATWLNGERWTDEIAASPPPGSGPRKLTPAEQALADYNDRYGEPNGNAAGSAPALDSGFGDRQSLGR